MLPKSASTITASHSVLIMIFVAIVAVAPSTSMAKEFTVGDESGWTVGFDYQAWAANKEFHVGDTLVFKHTVGLHNVFKVNGAAFQNCTVPPPSDALTSGNDTIVLTTSGRKCYICGVHRRCLLGGQKLAITVQSLAPTGAPAPSPLYSRKRPFISMPW